MNNNKRLFTLLFVVVVGLMSLVFYGFIFNSRSYEIKVNNNRTTIYEYLKLENGNKNIIYSPLSINTAISMLKEGSTGTTKKQLEQAIKHIKINNYNSSEKISFANSLVINNDYKELVQDKYIDTLNKDYNAEILYDDFTSPDLINNWVSEKTLGLINKLLDSVNPETKIALINALAIDIAWANPFSYDNTYGKEFYLSNGKTIIATTMNNKYSSNASYYDSKDMKVVSIDLEKENNTNLEFIAIMPKNLNEYINYMTDYEVNKLIDNLTPATEDKKLNLSIPKFKFDYSLKFKKDLNKIGVKKVFTKKAELDLIGQDLYVDDALHKATIDFSEDGIKAAAVTAFMLKNSLAPVEKTVDIEFNKPFIFLIRDKDTKDIWFVGKVSKPNEWESDKVNYGL